MLQMHELKCISFILFDPFFNLLLLMWSYGKWPSILLNFALHLISSHFNRMFFRIKRLMKNNG